MCNGMWQWTLVSVGAHGEDNHCRPEIGQRARLTKFVFNSLSAGSQSEELFMYSVLLILILFRSL